MSAALPPSFDFRSELRGDPSLADRMRSAGWSRAAIGEPLSWEDLLALSPTQTGQTFAGPCFPFLRNRFIETSLSSIDADGPLGDTRLGPAWVRLAGQRPFRDLAGVGWVVTLPPAPQQDLAPIAGCPGPPGHRLTVYRSPTGQPRGFLVHEAQSTGDDAELERWLGDPAAPFRTIARVRDPPPLGRCGGAESAVVTVDRPGEVAIDVTACAPALAIVNEAFAPGWTATLDGQRTSLLRADLFLQAVPVPTGAHRIVARYTPPALLAGLLTALLSAGALLAVRWAPRWRASLGG